jgi:hypothetical protein
VNQIGSISESIAAVKMAKEAGWGGECAASEARPRAYLYTNPPCSSLRSSHAPQS